MLAMSVVGASLSYTTSATIFPLQRHASQPRAPERGASADNKPWDLPVLVVFHLTVCCLYIIPGVHLEPERHGVILCSEKVAREVGRALWM